MAPWHMQCRERLRSPCRETDAPRQDVQDPGPRPSRRVPVTGPGRPPDLWGSPEVTHAELHSPLTLSVLRPSQATGLSGTRLWVLSRAGHAHLPLLAGVRGWTAPGRDHPSLPPAPVTAQGLPQGPAGSGGTGVHLTPPLKPLAQALLGPFPWGPQSSALQGQSMCYRRAGQDPGVRCLGPGGREGRTWVASCL